MSSDLAMPRDMVLFSTADWDHPFWTNKQHVTNQLAARGFRVLYIESLGLRRPSLQSRDVARIGRRLVRAWRPLRQVGDNLWVASPLALPWHQSRFAQCCNERWLTTWVKRQCHRLGFENPIVWTYNPLVGPLAAGLSGSLLVYHCVDDLSAAPGLPSAAIQSAEKGLVESADVVFTTSEALRARLAGWNPRAMHYLPNVADYDHFATARNEGPIPPEIAAIPRPRIGFVGALAQYKVDFELIASVAKARPDWHWVLLGQVGEGEAGTCVDSLRLPNVHLLGPRDYRQLPNYLRGFDVATIPCVANAYTAAMFPMKFFEYLAAGLPVVASNVPALAEFAHVCDLVDSTPAFTSAVERILQGHRSDRATCTDVARQHTWEWRMGEMLGVLTRAWNQKQLMPHSAEVSLQAKAG